MLKPNNMPERPLDDTDFTGDPTLSPVFQETQDFLNRVSIRLDEAPRSRLFISKKNRAILGSVGGLALMIACSLSVQWETGAPPRATATPREIPTVSRVLTAAAQQNPTPIPIILSPTTQPHPNLTQMPNQ